MKYIFILFIVLIQFSKSYGQIIDIAPLGEGVSFMAADSSMSLRLRFRLQSLFFAQKLLSSDDKVESQFLIRRARLKLEGIIFTPKLGYEMEIALSNKDIETEQNANTNVNSVRIILDAVMKYQFNRHWNLWIGQTKLPGNRERVVSSTDLQFVDRSLVNANFNIDRDIGIQLHGDYKCGRAIIKPIFAWSMGDGIDLVGNNFGGYNYTVRTEFLPFGAFTNGGDYFLADLEREPRPKIAFGFTYNLNDRSVRQQGQTGEFIVDTVTNNYIHNDLHTFFADMIFKYRGFSALVEYANTSAPKEVSMVKTNFNTGGGINAQAGYLFKNNYEIAGRYTFIEPDEKLFSAITETNEYTLALSKYISGHNLKVQMDFALIDEKNISDLSFRFRFQTEMQF